MTDRLLYWRKRALEQANNTRAGHVKRKTEKVVKIVDLIERVDFQLNYWSLQLHSISDQLSEFTLLLIVVGKQNLSAICAIWLTIWQW